MRLILLEKQEEMQENWKSSLFTPKKMGAQTAEANLNAGVAAINQIIGFLKKEIKLFRLIRNILQKNGGAKLPFFFYLSE